MITIKITNATELVEKEKNRFVARIAPFFIDVQKRVEQEIAREIKKALEERGVQAEVSVESDE